MITSKTLPAFKQINALYAGTCKFCGQKIAAGDPVLYYPAEHKIAHNLSQKCHDYKASLAATAAFTANLLQKEKDARMARVTAASAPQAPVAPALHDGYYTVVFDFDGEQRHKTFRIFTGKQGRFGEGKQMVAVFLGTDNTNEKSYQTFAFLNGNKLAVWKRYALYQQEIAAVNYLLDGENAEAAGILYASESGNCRRCNRMLTNPVSLNRGYGSECIKKVH